MMVVEHYDFPFKEQKLRTDVGKPNVRQIQRFTGTALPAPCLREAALCQPLDGLYAVHQCL